MSTATCAIVSLLSFVHGQTADSPPPPEPIQVQIDTTHSETKPPSVFAPVATDVPFARVLKDNLLRNLPRDVVLEKDHNWGHQAHFPSIQGVHRIEVLRNYGNWERMK